MGNAKGLQGPDGRPARQFGEHILEPGEPFTGDTMDVIRSLVDDREGESPSDGLQDEPSVLSKLLDKKSNTIPLEPTKVLQNTPQIESAPLADTVCDDFSEFSKLAESFAAAMGLEENTDSDIGSVRGEAYPQAAQAIITQSIEVAIPQEEPEVEISPTALEDGLTENIAQVMSDMDSFAGAKLAEIEANEVEKDSPAEPSGWNTVEVEPVPPLAVKRKWMERPPARAKPEWRKLNVVEGAQGRAVRQFLSQPRNVALLMLVYISLWRPWFIPTLTFVIFLSVVLIAISVGPDRVASFTGWWFARLKRRNPKKADRLIRRGNRFLRRVEGLADRLPPAWVAGFYLPELDGEDRTAGDDAHLKARLERIAAQEQVGAT